MLNQIGRLVVKTAGRDAGKKALIVDSLDKSHVLIDGETRRRKCNIAHLEPLDKVVKINKNASHEEVEKAFKELGIKAKSTKPKEKKERPRRKRKVKEKEEKKEAPKQEIKGKEPEKKEKEEKK
tara:strand:+ start:370 stop:741 length:372 start_codon:yes stop_codon:yes gene_type:complete